MSAVAIDLLGVFVGDRESTGKLERGAIMMENTLSKSRVIKLASQAALVLGLAVGSGLANAAIVNWDMGCSLGNRADCIANSAYASPHTFQSIGGPPNPIALNVWGY